MVKRVEILPKKTQTFLSRIVIIEKLYQCIYWWTGSGDGFPASLSFSQQQWATGSSNQAAPITYYAWLSGPWVYHWDACLHQPMRASKYDWAQNISKFINIYQPHPTAAKQIVWKIFLDPHLKNADGAPPYWSISWSHFTSIKCISFLISENKTLIMF